MFDWIIGFVQSSGYLGIAVLMFIENVFPPIPSELIMPLAGFAAAQGKLGIVPAVLAGSVGSLLGAVFWYYVGRWVGNDRLKRWASRHGRWLTLSPSELEQASRWFCERGGFAVLIGRLVPAVRTLISVPAGIARMPLGHFVVYSAFGTLAWTALLASAGYLLAENYQVVSEWIDLLTYVVIGLAMAVYVYRLVNFQRATNTNS